MVIDKGPHVPFSCIPTGLISYFFCSFDVITANNDLVSTACLRREGIDCRSEDRGLPTVRKWPDDLAVV